MQVADFILEMGDDDYRDDIGEMAKGSTRVSSTLHSEKRYARRGLLSPWALTKAYQ